MQQAVKQHADGVRRRHGLTVQIRVGLNSGDVPCGPSVPIYGWTTPPWGRRRIWRPDGAARGAGRHCPQRRDARAGGRPRRSAHWAPGRGWASGAVRLVGAGPCARAAGGYRPRPHALRRPRGRQGANSVRRWSVLGPAMGSGGGGRGPRGRQVAARVRGDPLAALGRLAGLESASVSYGQTMSYWPVIEPSRATSRCRTGRAGRDPRQGDEQAARPDASLEPALPALLALFGCRWKTLRGRGSSRHSGQRTLDAVKRLLLREAKERPPADCGGFALIDGESRARDNLVESLPGARLMLRHVPT
jgi:hypothetical protein